ncbi:MAG: hypothetical protein JW891_10805 [Candidatus Lokiarchaeota archaeon]|nr:hypothetical protein [Candidatus Lokiarchaeota archaeon]
MKPKSISIGFIPILIIASLCFLIPPVKAAKTPINAIYNWGEEMFNVYQVSIWENEIVESNYTGSDEYTYSYIYYCDNYTLDSSGNPLSYLECHSEGYSKSNYSSYNKITMSGNYTNEMNIDVYRVEATYGDSVQLIWMAGKKFDWYIDMWILDQSTIYNYTYDTYYNDTYTMVEKYYENDSIVDGGYNSIYHYEDQYNYSSDYSYTTPLILHQQVDYEFTMPMILTTQIFTTENGDNIAWMDMFYNYMVFNDTDRNGIYSAGMSNPSGGSGSSIYAGPSLYSSAEYMGSIMPLGLYGNQILKSYYKENFSEIEDDDILAMAYNQNISIIFPADKSIDDISNGIVFNPPTNEGDTISWDILYPEYPIYGAVYDFSSYMTEPIYNSLPYINMEDYSIRGLNYAEASPGNFSFGFDYTIENTNSSLDYTVDLPRITNESFYQGVNDLGLSLSMPHYTYFMASSDINQTTNTMLSKPADIFNFEVGGVPIGEIDMVNPLKKNYTIYDFPAPGMNSVKESKGGTIAKIITSLAEQNMGPLYGGNSMDPFSSLLFSLEDLVSDNPAFDDFYSYYGIETVNYPTWSGRRIVHDPTFIAYYATPTLSNEAINGYAFIPLVGVSSISILVALKRLRSKNKQ